MYLMAEWSEGSWMVDVGGRGIMPQYVVIRWGLEVSKKQQQQMKKAETGIGAESKGGDGNDLDAWCK
jgi:hypothetical protein